MEKCCSNYPKELVPFVKGDKICKVNKNALKIFNQYSLNDYQDIKKNNTIDLIKSKNAKDFGRSAVRYKINCSS